MCACDRRREQEAHRLDGLGVCGQAGAGAGRGPQSYNARESYRSQTRESTQTPFVTGLVTPVRLYDLRTWQATCQGWLRGWLAAHFGPLRQRWRLAVPEVNPKWTQNDTFRPTSGPALLRPTSTHFGDIPRAADDARRRGGTLARTSSGNGDARPAEAIRPFGRHPDLQSIFPCVLSQSFADFGHGIRTDTAVPCLQPEALSRHAGPAPEGFASYGDASWHGSALPLLVVDEFDSTANDFV